MIFGCYSTDATPPPLRPQIQQRAGHPPTIWLKGISDSETLKISVAGQEEKTIQANAIDAEALVSIELPLKPDATVKGSLAARIEPRREYSPPLARILASEDQYITVPHTKGCDVPVPATQASSDFLIYELVRRPQGGAVKRADLASIKPILAVLDRAGVPAGVRFGDRVIYRQTWRLLGQSLGDLVYSLPLAPLESVNLAIVEWSREDVAQRNETTTATESLLHAQFRDRSVIETVATAVSEYQGGFSVIGAAAGVGGPTVGAIGGGTSHSWGNRNLVGESVQQLSDAVQQASELVRSQTSTVVIQASQAERDALQTRTVSNYNQNHALTIQYYEVLRHFEVITAFEALEPVLLVPFLPLRFDRETALRFRRILERNALDPRIREWLDASERLGYSGNYPVPEPAPDEEDNTTGGLPAARLIERLQIKYITGNQTTVGRVKSELGLRSGSWVLADEVGAQAFGSPPVLEENKDFVSNVDGGDAIGLDLSTIEQVRVSWTQNGLQDGWKFKGIEIHYALSGGNGLESTPLFAKTADDALRYFTGSGTKVWTSELFNPPQPAASAQPANAGGASPLASALRPSGLTGLLRRIGIGGPLSTASIPGATSTSQQRKRADDAAQEMLLLEHLNANRLHYSRAVVMYMDGDERLRLLEFVLGDTDLLRDISFEPVGVSGHYVAFPYSGDRAPALDKALLEDLQQARRQTRHINLPTRGVFAEAHLSHCPAREERDPSRMYSPSETILPTAPAITGVQPGSRNAPPDTTPTPLPSPVVNIQNPAPAPDPVGLAAAFGLLGQMGPFRDMSTSREVSSLLGQLASGAISGAGVAPAAQRVQQALLDGTGNSGGGGSNFHAHPAVSASPQEIFDRMKLLDQSGLSKPARDRIRSNMLDPGAASDVINAGVAPFSSTQRTALLVFQENSGNLGTTVFGPLLNGLDAATKKTIENSVDYWVEEFEKAFSGFADAAGHEYNSVEFLEDATAVPAKFKERMKALANQGFTIDVITIGHGSDKKLVGFGGASITDLTLSELKTEFGRVLPIRMVYMMNCRGSTMNSAWIDAGATVAGGSRGDNWMPEPMLRTFWKNWIGGMNFANAMADAYRSTKGIWNFIYKDLNLIPAGVNATQALNDSEPILLGDGAVSIGTNIKLVPDTIIV